MLDNRIYTFLKLCETMNYRKTAEELLMTQPAVTQHIHFLEALYKTKLFEYSNKILKKTENGVKLEQYARTIVYNEKLFQQNILKPYKQNISIGATKTIGEYEIEPIALAFGNNNEYSLKLIIDNTNHLLKALDEFELDFLIIEGYFDKNKYDYMLYKNVEMVGICNNSHPFANKTIDLTEIFNENIIIREKGSGTRKVFENFLFENNYSYDSFENKTEISSFKIIEKMIEKNLGISFVYNSIPFQNKKLSTFKIKNGYIFHEFNFVFLKNSDASSKINKIINYI